MNHLRRLVTALPWLVLLGLGLLLAWALHPYVLWNELPAGDHPGHLFLAAWWREHLAPWLSGWNDRLWLGFPQDELYPPLVHVATGLLGAVLGDAVALKLLVAASAVGGLPAGFLLGRAHGLARPAAAALAALVGALAFLSARHLGTDLAYGVNLESTVLAGMVVAAIGWPLLLLSLAALARPAEGAAAGRPRLGAAVLLALTLLTHLVAGVVAALYLILRAAAGAVAARRAGGRRAALRSLRGYAATGALAVLLAAGWLVPFLAHRGLISAEAIGLRWALAETASLALAPLLAIAAALVRRDAPAAAWAALTATLAALTVLSDATGLLTHAYRFLPLVWLGGAVALGLLLARWSWAGGLVALAAALALLLTAPPATRGNRPAVLTPPAGLPASARTLVAVSEGRAPGHQAIAHAWAAETGSAVSHGISVESAGTNRALMNVLAELDRHLPIWSVYPPAAPPLDGDPQRADRWLRKLRHLGFTHVLTDLRFPARLGAAAAQVRRVGAAGRWRDVRYGLWALPPVGLVEPLRALPEVVPPERFAALAELYWLQGDPQHVVTDAPPPPEAAPAPPGATVSFVARAADGAGLRFHVAAPTPVPLLVRVGWHPGWEATADGAPVAVHRASPSLVLLYARGAVTLDWKRGWTTWLGLALSALGLVALGALLVRGRRRPAAA